MTRTTRMHRLGLPAVIAAVAMLAAACSSTTATGNTSTSSSGTPGPGITDTTITIGLETNKKSQDNQGGTGIQVPEAAVQVPILVNQINAAGGINGRKITLVESDFDPSQPAAPQENAACNTFTKDNKVFAVLALRTDASEAYLKCLEAAGTLLIASSPTQPVTTALLTTNPNLYAPQTMVLDRHVPAFVNALDSAGYLKGAKLGVLVSSTNPLFQSVYDSIMVPSLKDVGVTPVYTGKVPDDFAAAGDAAGAELPKMAAAGVDRLIALEPNGIGIGTFIAGGQQAGFAPKAAMSTFDTPDPVRAALPAGTLTGVTGYAFGTIVDDPEVDGLNVPATKCIADLTKAGQQVADSNGRGVTLVNCAGIWFLADALKNVQGVVNAESFAAGVKALGSSYESPWGNLDMTLDGRTGQHLLRGFEYQKGCNCFSYSSTTIPVTS